MNEIILCVFSWLILIGLGISILGFTSFIIGCIIYTIKDLRGIKWIKSLTIITENNTNET